VDRYPQGTSRGQIESVHTVSLLKHNDGVVSERVHRDMRCQAEKRATLVVLPSFLLRQGLLRNLKAISMAGRAPSCTGLRTGGGLITTISIVLPDSCQIQLLRTKARNMCCPY
jgi:hypothetical protein